MKIIFFSSKPYDKLFFEERNEGGSHSLTFVEAHLNETTARLTKGYDCVCAFVNDIIDRTTLQVLSDKGVRLIALRCAGFNNVDIETAKELGILVVRVPAYSPHAVAEHTIALLLDLNRKVHRSFSRIREGNFRLDGLLGFDLYGLTAGVVGTGKIGQNVIRILRGFGCEVLAHDPFPNEEVRSMGARYVEVKDLFKESDIISLHCPLTPETHHLVNQDTLSLMKDGVTLLNTSRGGLIDTKAIIGGLKSQKIGYLGLDVYEEEGDLFFEDLSSQVIQDDVFARLTTFHNVIITGHQAFFTREALTNIADTTLANITEFEQNNSCKNAVQ